MILETVKTDSLNLYPLILYKLHLFTRNTFTDTDISSLSHCRLAAWRKHYTNQVPTGNNSTSILQQITTKRLPSLGALVEAVCVPATTWHSMPSHGYVNQTRKSAKCVFLPYYNSQPAYCHENSLL